jgi:hypothetical protein
VPWEDRSHFFGIAARAMQQILVDHARKRAADKRKMLRTDRCVSQIADPSSGQDLDVVALHEALNEMAGLDPRQAEIVELRYFGGLTEEEVATVKGLSPVTIRRAAGRRFTPKGQMHARSGHALSLLADAADLPASIASSSLSSVVRTRVAESCSSCLAAPLSDIFATGTISGRCSVPCGFGVGRPRAGEVYKASTSPRADRGGESSADSHASRRPDFLQEARAASALTTPTFARYRRRHRSAVHHAGAPEGRLCWKAGARERSPAGRHRSPLLMPWRLPTAGHRPFLHQA